MEHVHIIIRLVSNLRRLGFCAASAVSRSRRCEEAMQLPGTEHGNFVDVRYKAAASRGLAEGSRLLAERKSAVGRFLAKGEHQLFQYPADLESG